MAGSNQWIADLFVLTASAGLALALLTFIERL